MKDAFGIEIKVNDKVIFNDNHGDWSFIKHIKGVVVGFTPYFVKIKEDNMNQIHYRSSKYVIVNKSDDYKDNWLRLAAEFDNYKKNLNKRLLVQELNDKNNILLNILDILDNIERAYANMNDDKDIKGIEAIISNINNILRSYDIISIDEYLGDKKDIFNVDYHEAVSSMQTNNKELDNTICGIINKGYIYNNGMILRIQKIAVYKYGGE